MFDPNDNYKQKSHDFQTKLHREEKATPRETKTRRKRRSVNFNSAPAKALAFVVILILLGWGINAFVGKQNEQDRINYLTASMAEIPSFDDYVNSNISINFRYPHLWQVYDQNDQILIANCAEAERDICQTTADGVRILIEVAEIAKPGPSFQFQRTTEKGYSLSVDRSSYYVSSETKTYRIEETGLSSSERGAIMNRIFDSIVIN